MKIKYQIVKNISNSVNDYNVRMIRLLEREGYQIVEKHNDLIKFNRFVPKFVSKTSKQMIDEGVFRIVKTDLVYSIHLTHYLRYRTHMLLVLILTLCCFVIDYHFFVFIIAIVGIFIFEVLSQKNLGNDLIKKILTEISVENSVSIDHIKNED